MEAERSKIGQIAFSISDHRETVSWYQHVFGFEQAGRDRFSGPVVDKIVGLHGSDLEAWWLIGRTIGMQLEFFKVRNPPARPRSAKWRPCDIGYTMFGIHVHDFDQTVERLADHSHPPLTEPIGVAGQRRVCVRDPDGVLVEIMERDPLPDGSPPGIGPAVRFVTMSVSDLEEAKRFVTSGLGLVESSLAPIHDASHEALWGLADARRRQAQYDAGALLLEIVQYVDPIGRPWPDNYRITDLGILNIAYLYDERWDVVRRFETAVKAGLKPNFPDLADLGNVLVMYGSDPQGFSMELVHIPREHYLETGFIPRPCDERITSTIEVNAPAETVWRVLSRLDRTGEWMGGFQSRLFREGPDDRFGVGAIRELYRDDSWILEEIVAITPGKSLSLAMRSGLSSDNHLSTFSLQEASVGSTLITYSISYTSDAANDEFRQKLESGAAADLVRLKRLVEAVGCPPF